MSEALGNQLGSDAKKFGHSAVVLARWAATAVSGLAGVFGPEIPINHPIAAGLSSWGIGWEFPGVVDFARLIAGALLLFGGALVIAIGAMAPGFAEGPVTANMTKELLRWITFPSGAGMVGAGVKHLFLAFVGENPEIAASIPGPLGVVAKRTAAGHGIGG